jgi:hypothetical protein
VDSRPVLTRRRLVAVWMVLAGLVVMHVLPAAQACPQTIAGHGAVTRLAMSPDHQPMVAEQRSPERRDPAGPPAAAIAATAGMPGMAGTVCTATPPSLGLAALLALLAAALLAVTCPARPRSLRAVGRGPHRRAPPRFGSALLHELCVSRT